MSLNNPRVGDMYFFQSPLDRKAGLTPSTRVQLMSVEAVNRPKHFLKTRDGATIEFPLSPYLFLCRDYVLCTPILAWVEDLSEIPREMDIRECPESLR